MEFKGNIVSFYHDYTQKKDIVVLASDTSFLENVEKLSRKEVRATLKQWREKRSLDANSYYWVLVGKIADANNDSRAFTHNFLLRRYGQLDFDENEKSIELIIRDDVDVDEYEKIHLYPTSKTKILDNGKLYRVYLLLRGSHTYDSKEMSTLIDGTVSEAKELGIETIPPEELERMLKAWKQ